MPCHDCGFTLQRAGFSHRLMVVRFVLDKLVLAQVYLWTL